MRQPPLIKNPNQNKYVKVYNLIDATKLDKLNELIEVHEKYKNKCNEFKNNLLGDYFKLF